jgi:hypothetical protein
MVNGHRLWRTVRLAALVTLLLSTRKLERFFRICLRPMVITVHSVSRKLMFSRISPDRLCIYVGTAIIHMRTPDKPPDISAPRTTEGALDRYKPIPLWSRIYCDRIWYACQFPQKARAPVPKPPHPRIFHEPQASRVKETPRNGSNRPNIGAQSSWLVLLSSAVGVMSNQGPQRQECNHSLHQCN